MAVSQFPAASTGGGTTVLAYKGDAGDNTVEIEAGFYLVRGTVVDSFPITIDGQIIQSDTDSFVLDAPATNLNFNDDLIFSLQDFEPATHNETRFENGSFFTMGNGNIWKSSDGISWQNINLPNFTNISLNIAFGDNQYVLTGQPYVATSPDAVTWTERSLGFNATMSGLAFGAGIFVAVGIDFDTSTQEAATSSDGSSWTEITLPNAPILVSVIFEDNQFIAFGEDGYIATSPDGTSWTERNSGQSNSFLGGNCATFGDGLYIAVGSEFVITSVDGINWTEQTVPSTNYFGVAFGAGNYVITGDSQTVLTSPDAVTWTQRDLPGSEPFRTEGLAFGNNRFVFQDSNYTATANPPLDPQYLVIEQTETIDLT